MTGDEQAAVLRRHDAPVAWIDLNRPRYANAINVEMIHALDAALGDAVADEDVRVIVIGGTGKHFSGGHDISSPGRDVEESFPRVASHWWDHSDKPIGEATYIREREAYLEMCRRLREVPKPTIAMVRDACIAGGLSIAWACDLIVAADDAYFADPVVRMGIPAIEYFAHVHTLNARLAKEMLFLGDRVSADRAYEMGMINRVVPEADLDAETERLAARIADKPAFALALAKQAVNQAEDISGLRAAMDAAFGLHQVGHLHNATTGADHIGGKSPKAIADEMD